MGYLDAVDQRISTYRVRMWQKNGDGPYSLILLEL